MLKTICSLLVLSLVATTDASGQVLSRRQLRQQAQVAQQTPVVQEAAAPEWARKLLDTSKIDFGVIATGSDSKRIIRLKNVLDQPVHIQNVTTTCGCSVATPSKRTLQPGEEAEIEVAMNTRRFKRRKDSNVLVTFDLPSFATVRIPITAYIRTDVVFEPGMVQFGPVEQGEAATQQIHVAYAGRPDWVIRDLKVDNPHLAATARELSRNGGRVDYVLDITLKDSAPMGRLRDLVILVTDDEASPYVPLLVEANVEPEITVTPATIALATLRPGESKATRIVVRSRSKTPFEIERIESASGGEAVKYRRPAGKSPVHVVPITVTAPMKPGRFEEEYAVWIAGRPAPVRFKVTGEIAARVGSNQP